MNHTKRKKILMRLQASTLKPMTELNYTSHFELLIATVLSAQTTDISVNKITEKLYPIANTAASILELGIDKVKEYIRTIGLWKTKANNIINLCRILVESYNGSVPSNRKALESLPGVGRKTANIVLNTAFGLPTIAVDRHVFRVCNRTNFAVGQNVKAVENNLLKFVPKKLHIHCHYWFILHGRYTCVARKPKCFVCKIKDLCEFKEKINL
ncbi:endonuclease III [Candidatus Erwinia haradaeae]|uniref:Endonuclease III n=1 Tax=Candidatus Erwinia haradaeae TaxID=1922217 RepID=A0A451DI00_9GAMM|nr:endonuclease III [Candidatus Erwinia haradaeae]VFP86279.1 Endonuclease III [Candidatus Erwinia haradaeae]